MMKGILELRLRVKRNPINPEEVQTLNCHYCGVGISDVKDIATAAYYDGWRSIGQYDSYLQPVAACPNCKGDWKETRPYSISNDERETRS